MSGKCPNYDDKVRQGTSAAATAFAEKSKLRPHVCVVRKTLEVSVKLSDEHQAIKVTLPIDESAPVTNKTVLAAIRNNGILSMLVS